MASPLLWLEALAGLKALYDVVEFGVDYTVAFLYLVPSAFVHDHCAPANRVFFKIPIDKMAPFKNNWEMLKDRLGPAQPPPADAD
jgi:hypothetical protein